MSTMKILSAAEQARWDYRQSLRNEPLEELLAPNVLAMIEGDPDGLLNAPMIATSMIVEMQNWRESAEPFGDTVYLYWTRENESEQRLIGMLSVASDATFPVQVSVDRDDYLQGRLLMSYMVESNLSGNQKISQSRLITVDTIAPCEPNEPLPLQLATKIITDNYLEENGGQLIATVPEYPDREPGDRLFFYWVSDVPDDPTMITPTLGPLDLDASMEFAITRDILEHAGNGQCLGIYVLLDKAGNRSHLSVYIEATVALGPLPENLLPPEVPLANDGRIDRLDALEVVVEIPVFENWSNGDMVLVNWGGTALEPYPTGPAPQFPLRISVPWAVLKANYDFLDAGDGDQPLTVSYQVARGEALKFPETPLSKDIIVNLKVVGPVNPDEPETVNPTLAELRVVGESGIDNQLNTSDHGKDATAFITLYEEAKEGDYIWVYWKGQRVPNYHVVTAEDVPGTEVSVVVPWSIIEASGNDPLLPVHYIITDIAEVNFQQSPSTSVIVKVLTITFEAPEFPHIWTNPVGGNRAMNCSSVRKEEGVRGFYVYVKPDGRYLRAGVEVTMHWRVTEWPDGGTVAGTEFSEVITLTPQQEVNGITWFVHPYETYIFPAYSGTESGVGDTHVQYSLEAGGEVVWSEYAKELIGLSFPGGGTCPA
ncbi:hypothetical protein [Pseudomonas sp. 5P_5.1_Bac1]|uniref:hypothetical protein n=1 Tax=Pseudomonas sp. 5P_5.1_Bac1 TaxID=2971616 RepID=UPI0021C948B0|nr:hypothetical protein [Pseudomonas sp. 5P_5.1_Bac1]MCU1723083.1 hypothetical protein [Pseudomonas sp. 5P_5.1_Bac1]